MYCSKCGTKAIDGAAFCQKCGAKLIQDHREVQESVSVSVQESVKMSAASVGTSSEPEQKSAKGDAVLKSEPIQVSSPEPIKTSTVPVEAIMKTTQKADIHEETHSVPESDKETYTLLKENVDKCPAIKSAKQVKMGICFRGKIYNHIVGLASGQARITSAMAFPYSILEGLPVGVLAYIASRIGWDFVEYGSIYFEDYALPFALCLFIIGLLIAFVPYIGRREKASVREYVRKTVEPEGISLIMNETKPVIRFVIAAIFVLAGALVFMFGVLDVELGDIGTDAVGVFDDGESDNRYGLDSDESVPPKDSFNIGEVLYKDIPLSTLFEGSAVQTAELLGLPSGWDRDDDIRLYINDDTEEVESVEIWNVGALTINGETLEKNRDGLAAILGEPVEEGDSGGGYAVDYQLEAYSLYFELGESDAKAWRVTVYPVQQDAADGYVPHTETTVTICSLNEAAEAVYEWLDSHPLGYETELNYPDSAMVDGAYRIQLMVEDDYIGVVSVSAADGSMIITIPAMDDTGEWTESFDFPIDQWYSDIWCSLGDDYRIMEEDILYGDFQIYNLMGASMDDVMGSWGTPLDYSYGGGYNYCIYEGIEFAFDYQGEIYGISIEPDMCMVDGDTLDKNRDELTGILGIPAEEGWGINYNDENIYSMQYKGFRTGINVAIYMASPESQAYEIYLWQG